MKKTLVLGASPNDQRYSNRAVKLLRQNKIDTIAVGKRKGQIEDVAIDQEINIQDDIHTITMYLGAKNQLPYYDEILALSPKRIIFNPGAENHELKKLAQNAGIEVVEGCTLVMLSVNTF